jgi:hypothetical protein
MARRINLSSPTNVRHASSLSLGRSGPACAKFCEQQRGRLPEIAPSRQCLVRGWSRERFFSRALLEARTYDAETLLLPFGADSLLFRIARHLLIPANHAAGKHLA